MHADDETDDDALLPLADRIADGWSADSDGEPPALPDNADPGVLRALLDIAAIGAAHGAAERSFERMHPPTPPAPRHWAHLTILEKIGEGAFGEVYRAHDEKLQIDVALKLATAHDGRPADASRILGEARLLARVKHPNVVRVYGADHKQGRVGLWMDLISGQTLEAIARAQGFGANEAINVGIELCRALAAVHAVGVLHGDIKAHNVVRRDGGQIVLVDFGASRSRSAEAVLGNEMMGTPVYLAPEVLNGEPRSTASDVYSLGVLLFHLVTNDYPVYGASHVEFLEAHKSGARQNLRDLRADLPEGFIRVVDRATAPEPGDRFTSAGAFESALVQLLAPAPPAPPSRWSTWIVVGGAIAGLAGGGGLYWNRAGSPGTAPTTQSPRLVVPRESYEIDAAFYRTLPGGGEERLGADSRVRVSDEIHLAVQTSKPTYLYVVNEDDKGVAYLLFPDPAHNMSNPIAPNARVRVPPDLNWKVDSAGGREHFIVFASTDVLAALGDAFQRLRSPRRGDEQQPLAPGTVDRLRGLGRLTPAAPRYVAASRFRDVFTTPLKGPETATGMWVRQLTVESAPDQHPARSE
jgi:serine/threonine-protein kinase